MLLERLHRAEAHLLKPLDEEVKEREWVIIQQWYVPREFRVEFVFPTLVSREKLLWTAELLMEISERGVPRAVEVTVKRESHSAKSGFQISQRKRVEKEHLSAVSTDLRHLEAYAVALVANTFQLLELDEGGYVWELRSRIANDYEEDPKDWKELQDEMINRTRKQKWDDEFMKDIARIFRQAERENVPTNVKIAEVMGVRMFEEIDSKRVQKWVREARDRGFLDEVPKKMTPATKIKKAVPKDSLTKKAVGKAVPNKRPTTKEKGNK